MLRLGPISKASASQRAGRAGRTQPGKCFRLYTKETFDLFAPSSDPDILTTNVQAVILTLLALGLNPLSFDYLDSPHPESLLRALGELQDL